MVHKTGDPEVVIVEFRYQGSANSRPFDLQCIFVVRVRDGPIIESRDYSDHVAFARAFAGSATLRLHSPRMPAPPRPGGRGDVVDHGRHAVLSHALPVTSHSLRLYRSPCATARATR